VLSQGTNFGFRNVLVALGTGSPVHALGMPFLPLWGIQVLPGNSSSALGTRIQLLHTVGTMRPVIVNVKGTTSELLVATLAGEMVHMEHLVHSFDVLPAYTGATLATGVTTTSSSS